MKRVLITVFLIVFASPPVFADGDLNAVKSRGVLRHLGVPYANFVTGTGTGLSVEVMQLFASHIGVKYQYVKTSWESAFKDLIGKEVVNDGDNTSYGNSSPIRGDVIDSGLTILPWRQKAVAYSTPTFPTQVWLIAGINSTLRPIKPSGDLDIDIKAVKSLLAGRDLLGKEKTCLDPSLYRLRESGAKTSLFSGDLNELAPAVISGVSETAILDVPDTLVAMEKWPGQFIVIGPISPPQEMAAAFRNDSPELRQAFNRFFDTLRANGSYSKLVKKYYPTAFEYYPDFFTK